MNTHKEGNPRWLFVPSIPSVPDSECLRVGFKSHLKRAGLNVSLWVTVSGKQELRPLSWHAWRKRKWVKLLLPAIWQPLMADRGVEEWISSVQGCLVSPIASPENRKVTPIIAPWEMMTGQSLTFSESSTRCNQQSSSSKMSLRGLPKDTSIQSAKDYANWVIRSKTRSSSLRRMLAQITRENESLSWPTARASERGQYQRDRGEKGSERPTLTGSAKTWATATCGQGGANVPTKPGVRPYSPDLKLQILNWPTPASRDFKGMNGGGHFMTKSRPHMDQLPNSVAMWATARTPSGGKESKESKAKRKSGGIDLQTQIFNFPDTHSAETTGITGQLLQVWTPPACPQLNPNFQWWLMGWPSPTMIFSGSAGMAWIHWWQQLRLVYSLIESSRLEQQEND